GFTGFCGLDFIRRPDGTLVFLEFSARMMPVIHLGKLIGADLCGTLFAELNGGSVRPTALQGQARVALFPQDWRPDPLCARRDVHCDIPRDDPSLVAGLSADLPTDWDRAQAA